MMGSEVSGGQQNVHSEHATLYIWDVAPIAFRSYRSASLGERGTRTYMHCIPLPRSIPQRCLQSSRVLARRRERVHYHAHPPHPVRVWVARCVHRAGLVGEVLGAVFHDEDEPAVDWRVVESVTSGARIVYCVKLLRVGQSLHSLNMR